VSGGEPKAVEGTLSVMVGEEKAVFEKCFDVMKTMAGSVVLTGSTVLEAKAPLVMDRKFNPGFHINLHIKDLANVFDTSHELGVPLPLTAAVMEMMQAVKVDGEVNSAHYALVKYYEKLTHVEVKR
jgi:2-hydroxy-3-oxopropionate reductase